VQIAKIRIATGDNLFERLAKNQSISRVILKHSVSLMVSRLGPRFPAASLRGLLYPIVQTVVVERGIAKISSHDEYAELRTAGPDAEFALLQKMQETLQKNLSTFRKDMTHLVSKIFQSDTICPVLNHVKYRAFGVAAGAAIISGEHPIMAACMTHPVSYEKGMLDQVRFSAFPAHVAPPTPQGR
jgi:hypothetical protein